LGGENCLRVTEKGEFGWTEIQVTAPSPLFEGLPGRFHSLSHHYDEVCTLPPGAEVLARSRDCEIQAFQLKDQPVFGIQFHPEKDTTEAEKTYRELKAKRRHDRFQNYAKARKLYDPKI